MRRLILLRVLWGCVCACPYVYTAWVSLHGNIYEEISAIISHMIVFVIIYPWMPLEYAWFLCLSLTFGGVLWTHKVEFIILWLHYGCVRHSAHERLQVPPGLVQGSAAGWRWPRAVFPSPNSRGPTDRLNDAVGVAACLRLILRTWLKFAVGSFSSVLSRQRGPFQRCLCVCVRAVSVCLHMYACSPEEMHKRKIAFPVIIRAVLESYGPRDDEFCMCSSQVSTPPVYCMPYIHALSAVPAGRHLTVETTQICLCLWVSVSLNQVPPRATPSSWKTLIINWNWGTFQKPNWIGKNQLKHPEKGCSSSAVSCLIRWPANSYLICSVRSIALSSPSCTVHSCVQYSLYSCLARVRVHLGSSLSHSWLHMWDESCNSCCCWLSCTSDPLLLLLTLPLSRFAPPHAPSFSGPSHKPACLL